MRLLSSCWIRYRFEQGDILWELLRPALGRQAALSNEHLTGRLDASAKRLGAHETPGLIHWQHRYASECPPISWHPPMWRHRKLDSRQWQWNGPVMRLNGSMLSVINHYQIMHSCHTLQQVQFNSHECQHAVVCRVCPDPELQKVCTRRAT